MLEKYPKIQEAITQNRLVFFVGSGFSRSLGFPDWKGLLGEILNPLIEIDPKQNPPG